MTRLLFVNFSLSIRFVCCCRFVRCCWNHRESRQSVCVTDFYSIVNVLYLPFALSIAIYCWTCILVNVKYIVLPHLRYIVALLTRKSYFERFGRICCCRFVRCCWNHRESRQSVCVTDFYSIVNVLYLPFALSIAIYCWTCILVNVKYIVLPHLRYIVALFTRKSYFERFGRILSWPFTVPLR